MPALLRSAASDIVLITTRPAAISARCRSRCRSTAAGDAQPRRRASRSPRARQEHVQRHGRAADQPGRDQPQGDAGRRGLGNGSRPVGGGPGAHSDSVGRTVRTGAPPGRRCARRQRRMATRRSGAEDLRDPSPVRRAARTAFGRALAAATPADRDRVVDLVRAIAVTVVVVWHTTLSLTAPGRGPAGHDQPDRRGARHVGPHLGAAGHAGVLRRRRIRAPARVAVDAGDRRVPPPPRPPAGPSPVPFARRSGRSPRSGCCWPVGPRSPSRPPPCSPRCGSSSCTRRRPRRSP